MKRLSLWIAVLALTTTTPALAQQTNILRATNTQELDRFATAAAKDYKANRSKALEVAKKRGWLIEKTTSDGRVISLQGLDSEGMPIYYITDNNSRAAATVGTNQLWAGGKLGLMLSGSGAAVANKLALWDGGKVRPTHQELKDRVIQKDNAVRADDHATHVAGTMIATGVNPLAKGMAYAHKTLNAYDFNQDVSEMAVAAKDLLVSNHSYGSISGWRYNSDRKGTPTDPYWEWWGNPAISTSEDFKFGYYDNSASNWDKIAYEAPYYLIVKSSGNNRGERGPAEGQPYYRRSSGGSFEVVSARTNVSSNDGYDIISTYGNAKNILTVGAVEPIAEGYLKPSDVRISTFSSWGPTDDGRIKPDIVGNGVSLLSSMGSADDAYASLSGTSMSSPNVAGSLLLLQEHYSNVADGKLMRAATLKGVAIHTADEAGNHQGPDYVYGWGLLNMARAAALISDFSSSANPVKKHILEERELTQGGNYTFDVVASGEGPLVVTISWTDPQAVAIDASVSLNNRTPRLVNDLDLRVSRNSASYQPWTLDPANPANAAVPGDNKLDNVEQVYIANAVPGEVYTISIRHKNTLSSGKQAYSIMASGVGGSVFCTSAPLSDQGTTIQSVKVDNTTISPTRTAGCTTYSNFTENQFTLDFGQTRTLTITPGTCTTANAKIAKVYIDWNGNGSFSDADELVAVSGVVTDNSPITAPVTVPESVTKEARVRMRIILAETTDAASFNACGTYASGETQDYLVQLSKPDTEVAMLTVNPAGQNLCATTDQPVQVILRNNGAQALSNIPVSVTVRKNGTTVATLSGVYTSTLYPTREAQLTLSSFETEAGATYELVAETNIQGDAKADNNKATYSFTVNNMEPAPVASVARCGDNPNYALSGTGDGIIYWYKQAGDSNPVAVGNDVLLSASQVGETMFAGLNDFAASVGYKTKSDLPNGGYNQFSPDVYVRAFAPMVLERARLYIGHSGTITFTVYNEDNEEVSARTLQVTATRFVGAPGPQVNDPNDKGAVYYLGLELPAAGNYRIAITYGEEATIYRNNLATVNYPVGIPNVFLITGNSAETESQTYYYYFYDLKVRALGCKSERVAVDVKGTEPLVQPLIAREQQTLRSSVAEGNQWYLNGEIIPGATNQLLVPTESGEYSVETQKEGCISERSVVFNFKYQPEKAELGKDFVVSPNPSTGIFLIEGELQVTDVVNFMVYDMLGNLLQTGSINGYNGQSETKIDMSKAASGMYLLRIQKNNDVIIKRLVLQR